MATRVIKIKKGYTSNGNLDLSDHGHTTAGPGDTILWQIKSGSGVDSIQSIDVKGGSANIWSSAPHPQGSNWTGNIMSSVPAVMEYNYKVTWLKNGNAYVCDPKIAVRPSTTFNTVINLIFILFASLMSVLTFSFVRNYKKHI